MEDGQVKIIPAQDLVQLHRNLSTKNGLSEQNMAFFVPLYQETITNLEQRLGVFSTIVNDTVYLMGQTGSGKTTVLDFLKYKSSIKDRYFYVTIDFNDSKYGADFSDPDFDIVEVYITIFNRILNEAGTYLSEDYFNDIVKKLSKLEKEKNITEVTEQKNKWSFAAFILETITKLGFGSFGINWQIDASTKESIRSLYKTKAFEFLMLLNDLITKVGSELEQKEKKPLFLILDGLEKIRDVQTIEKIFNSNSINSLKRMETRKIIVCPVHLSSLDNNTIAAETNNEFLINLKIFDNPRTHKVQKQSEEVEKNINMLIEVLDKRIEGDYKEMIEEKALQKVIFYSGGFLHDFNDILKDAIIQAASAGSKIVRIEHIEKTISRFAFARAGTFSFSTDAVSLLYGILCNNTIPDEQKDNIFTKQVLINNIIIVKNKERWHLIHPLIQDTVKSYGDNLKKTPASK